MRSWLFAETIGRTKRIDYDHEVVAPAGTTATTTDDDRTMVAAGDSRPERVEISDPERRDTP